MNRLPKIAVALMILAGAMASWRRLVRDGRALIPTPPEPTTVMLSSGTIGTGGSLSHSLLQSGVPPTEETQLERALKPFVNPRHSKATDRYEIYVSSGLGLSRLTYWPDAFQFYCVERSSGTAWHPHLERLSLTATTVGVQGQIHTSLWDAMIQQGVPPEMIYRFAEIFGWRFDFLTEPRQGDAYKLVWTRHRAGSAIRDDEIRTAAYSSREKGALEAHRWNGDYYDGNGNSLRGEFLRAPLAYRRISSRFTERRFHPILRIYRPHHGIDYSAARGTPAVSIGDGVVIERGWGGGLGNQIRIRHARGFVSIYGHLMGFAPGTHTGSRVKQGQVVGYVGSTGLSTGPHLHFGFEHDGQLINFLALKMNGSQPPVPRTQREAFVKLKNDDNALLNRLTPGGPLQLLSSTTP